MSVPVICRSTDVGIPTMSGTPGAMQRVLDACLVNGYGVAASGVLTSDNVNVADGDTVTIAGRVYTFRTTLNTQGPTDQVLIGANADASLLNLAKALNSGGVYGTDYVAVYPSIDVSASTVVTAHTITLLSKVSGTAGNALTTTTASAGTPHLSFGAGTLSGGTVLKASAGWTKEFVGAPHAVSVAMSSPTVQATSIAVLMPSAGQARVGDLCVVYLQMYDSVAGGTTCNTPAGWTLLHASGSFSSRANGDKAFVFYRYLTAADFGINVTFANSAGNLSYWTGIRNFYRNVELGSVPIIAGLATSSGTAPVSPAVTTPAPYYYLASAVFNNTTSAGGITGPPNWAAVTNNNNTSAPANQVVYYTDYALNIGSGVQGSFGWSNLATAGGYYAVTLAFKPQSVYQSTAVYRAPAGARPYLHLEEATAAIGAFPDAPRFASFEAYESMSDAQTGVNNFFGGSALNYSTGIPKSVIADGSARTFLLAADDRTLYLFVGSGLVGGYDGNFSFGEFYSYLPGDAYKQQIDYGSSNSSPTGAWGTTFVISTSSLGYVQRNYLGVATPTSPNRIRDLAFNTSSSITTGIIGLDGVWTFPNPNDGGVYACRIELLEAGPSSSKVLRGRMRGILVPMHPVGSFSDGEVVVGTGEYAGRTFVVVKPVNVSSAGLQNAGGGGALFLETTAWEASS